ncbi:hypothetical protein EVAR_16913_1 [Eumeta japonica]|uniref:Uncharacterized protein n=1 Tax=Eumeta variegata TaxID=151549 RepID=A0A4C1TVA4_EUMVA|nr:hypothetical protein EVAR_16913_1 [Eumeta japonica]
MRANEAFYANTPEVYSFSRSGRGAASAERAASADGPGGRRGSLIPGNCRPVFVLLNKLNCTVFYRGPAGLDLTDYTLNNVRSAPPVLISSGFGKAGSRYPLVLRDSSPLLK